MIPLPEDVSDEINESMENIFGTISKIEKETYPEEGYEGVSLQPKSWEPFSLDAGRKLIDLVTDPKGYETKRDSERNFQIAYAISYMRATGQKR